MTLKIWKDRIKILENEKFLDVLEKIRENPGSMIMDIARECMIPHQTAQSICARLKKAGFIDAQRRGREVRVSTDETKIKKIQKILYSV